MIFNNETGLLNTTPLSSVNWEPRNVQTKVHHYAMELLIFLTAVL